MIGKLQEESFSHLIIRASFVIDAGPAPIHSCSSL